MISQTIDGSLSAPSVPQIEQDKTPPPSLYQRVLGDQFDRLPRVLRRGFIARNYDGVAIGTLTVVRAACWPQRAVAWLLRLPKPGVNVAVSLPVHINRGREVWVRRFGGQRIVTTQWQEGEYLVEQVGLLKLVFRLQMEDSRLRFVFQHNAIGRWKLPFTLLQVDATADGAGDRWRIEVQIRSPWLGSLTTSPGEIMPC